ncbi:hypothetical protein FIV06_26725 [Labrenzia sp. THAF191b]|nr:hypothetical protein FIV06_26725 [Labrenzia sp. THAF191b]QFT07365.1 hypothetical protein FIV05_26720 [Labrenzia sp. THAF191a]QFT18909.1 hypothetical protein FIV03_26735 [Labrenzia sp. THAF187b]
MLAEVGSIFRCYGPFRKRAGQPDVQQLRSGHPGCDCRDGSDAGMGFKFKRPAAAGAARSVPGPAAVSRWRIPSGSTETQGGESSSDDAGTTSPSLRRRRIFRQIALAALAGASFRVPIGKLTAVPGQSLSADAFFANASASQQSGHSCHCLSEQWSCDMRRAMTASGMVSCAFLLIGTAH